jgi:hypothetical protein
MRWLWVLLAALLCLAPAGARADRTYDRVTLDRIDVEPSTLPGLARVRAYVSALSLTRTGREHVLGLEGDRPWRLKIGSSDKRIPYAIGRYGQADADTAIVLVVATSSEFAEALPAIRAALRDVLVPGLAADTQIGVIGYGATVVDTGKLGPLKGAAERIDALADSGSGVPDLIDPLETALRVLRRVKTTPEGRPMRKIIVLVSDGRHSDPDREVITDLGARAGRAGVRIHSLAFAPHSGSKGPLLNLGELSKRSLGTFRWIRLAGEQGWAQQVRNLTSEIQRQFVLTFFAPAEEIAGKQVTLSTTIAGVELTSNRVKAPRLLCGKVECAGDDYCVAGACVVRNTDRGPGILGWLLWLIGGLVGFVVIGGGALALVQRVRHRAPRPAPPPAPSVPAPAAAPAHAPIAPIIPGGRPSAPHAAAPAIQPSGGYQPAPAPAQPVFFVMTGPRTGQRALLHHGFVIGKAPGCHLVLDGDGFASGQHAMVLMDVAGNCTLVDQGSTNGTFVNGIRITAPVALSHGMAVRVGSTDLRFLTQ